MWLLLNLPNCALYTALYYGLARFLARRLVRLEPTRAKWMIMTVVVISVIGGFLPIYGLGGHGAARLTNAFQSYIMTLRF